MNEIKLVDIDLNLDVFEDEYLENDIVEFENNLTEKEFEALREYVIQSKDEGNYFKCEIYSEIKTVRFGVVSHRAVDDKVQVRGSIVLESYDQNDEKSRYADNHKSNLVKELITTKIKYDNLVAALLEKNIFTKEEVEKINNVSHKELLGQDFNYRTF
ncbi:hypothetical protein [Priestia megaterium]|uniref:hypothetical protein n=1 Tax=Priestia megaterium TaxID=1404 RepID=UPI00366C6413